MRALARYRVIRRLGEGAAGGVYLVEDRVLGGTPVALKRVEHSSDPNFRDSFAREFAVLASLSLPGVARVHDLGMLPADGELPQGPFFTRAYVEGEPLDRFATTHGHGADQVVDVFLRALDITAALHRLGVVHGDLKPANIIVDAHAAPHLIDFGLASHGATASGLRGSGTPAFMAPELLRGGAPSVLGDVYALGATLWKVITGQLPSLGAGGQSTRLGGGQASAGEADPAHGALLEAARWAMQEHQDARAPSVDELAARVERALGRNRQTVRRRAFVAPRPRGRESVLLELEARTRERRSAACIGLICGARGMGKTTLICELKWRLQLSGARVIEVCCAGAALDPLVQLLRQASLFRPGEAEAIEQLIRELERAPQATSALIKRIASALTSEAEQPMIVLVDDIDCSDARLSQVLSAAVYDEGRGAPCVIASCEQPSAASVAQLGSVDRIELGPLDAATATQIVAAALGPVDTAASAALVAHAAGNPGLLVEALSFAAEREGVSAGDLAALPPGEIGASLARARFQALGAPGQRLLGVLAAAVVPLPALVGAELLGAEADAVHEELARGGLVRRREGMLSIADLGLGEWLRRAEHCLIELARGALALPSSARFDALALAHLALAAGDAQRVSEVHASALQQLVKRGAHAQAARLCERCLAHVSAERVPGLRLELMDLYEVIGEHGRAAEHAEWVLAAATASEQERARARVGAGRACVAGARFDRAIELLSGLAPDAPGALRAQAARVLARVHLRRGDQDAARAAVARGLDAGAVDDPSRAELLAIEGNLLSMRGERERAQARFELALEAARRVGSRRDEAQVLGYRAFSQERAGDLEGARSAYEECLAVAREAGDLGLTATYAMNLGNVSFRTGHSEGAEQHFKLASRLSRRAGRAETALMADNNLAHVHVYLGAFARARALAESSLAEAERLGAEVVRAHALQILGDTEARVGDTEAALARYDAAAVYFKKTGRSRELAEVLLDAAEALLERGDVSDASAASARLAQARDVFERHGVEDLELRFKLLLGRARAANGDVEGALADLERLETLADAQQDRELRWVILATQAQLCRMLGSELLSGKKAREAAELIEAAAARAPRAARDAFRAEPRRRAVLELARAQAFERSRSQRSRVAVDSALLTDQRVVRLLEISKRLAREHDLARLLERITDAAVELSGAERGFVLLVDEHGQLATHTVRASGGVENDPHAAFSRSIAEAVLIDGEPILTFNARDDRRVNEFMSVHKLMLKSVACIPISGPRGVVGVLYLEHRLRAGRFQEGDLDLLIAFGDQAAIALENARLWQENEARRRELEQRNAELSSAKADIERLLEARTEELEQARSDLGRARAELAGQAKKHGIVGQSAAMRRVFALIERVQDSLIPVVIQGESGTGKELVARAIHSGGARRAGPFVAINCAALPEHLLESELFGHTRGAFTGADRDRKGLFVQAHGGTLFLDEFADMPARMQIDLLRVLQENKVRPLGAEADVPVDVRIVAATNRPLSELVSERKLREDLYYRLSVVELRLPPLRDRFEDVPLLCEHLLSRIAENSGERPRRLSRAALERIIETGLPGNVRQLEHLLLSAAMMAESTTIEAQDLPLEPTSSAPPPAPGVAPVTAPLSPEQLPPADLLSFKSRERQKILAALEQHAWNRAKAASALGMPRRTFYRRLSEFGIL